MRVEERPARPCGESRKAIGRPVTREAKGWSNEAQTGDRAGRELSKPVTC